MTSKTVLLNDKFIRTVLLVLFLFPRSILIALFAVITGNRVIQMPTFLCDEMQDYIKSLYAVQPTDRIFTVTKSYLHREMDRGAKETSVKRIRIHDLRHSHISLLIDMGFTALAIADLVGHESIDSPTRARRKSGMTLRTG